MPAPAPAADWPALLRAAAAGAGLAAAFQPIVDLARGVVVGYEALARFPGHPVHRPDAWFAAAQAHGRAADLQAAALRTALAARTDLPPDCFLTVNVGPEVLATPAVRRVWAEQGDLSGLVVELTEQVPVRDEAALGADLDRIRAAGALIAVDDAGAGHAGLTRLLTLRPDMIKLDRELIHDVDRHEAKRALVEMLGTFAGRIDAWLLAEGVERPAELATLATLGVPLGQGYHLGPPAPTWTPVAADAQRLLRTTRPAGRAGTLRGCLEHPPVVTDAAAAAAAFADTAVDVVVLCDDRHRPLAALDDRSAPGVVTRGMRVAVDTPPAEAALRAITRPGRDWSTPLLCTDPAGRYVGIVRVQRLLRTLAA